MHRQVQLHLTSMLPPATLKSHNRSPTTTATDVQQTTRRDYSIKFSKHDIFRLAINPRNHPKMTTEMNLENQLINPGKPRTKVHKHTDPTLDPTSRPTTPHPTSHTSQATHGHTSTELGARGVALGPFTTVRFNRVEALLWVFTSSFWSRPKFYVPV